MGNTCCVAKTQPQVHPSGADWLNKTYQQLEQPNPAQTLERDINLYKQLSSNNAGVFEARLLHTGSPAGAHYTLQASARERIVATVRGRMARVDIAPTPDLLRLSRADMRAMAVTDNIRVRAQAGFAGSFLGAECPLSTLLCCSAKEPGPTDEQLTSIFKAQNHAIKTREDDPKFPISELMAKSFVESILEPDYIHIHKNCVVVGSCYNGCQGMLRVLEWTDNPLGPEHPRVLHCKHVLFDVPIWLMTKYVGAGVSKSIVMRYTDPNRQVASSLDVFSNDPATWSDVGTSRLQWEWRPEEGGSSTASVLDQFPRPAGSWLQFLFATNGTLDYGADAINVDGGNGLYLCSTIPAMLAMAATKVKDLGSICCERYTYAGSLQAPPGSTGRNNRDTSSNSSAIEIIGPRNRVIKGLGHTAVTTRTTELAGMNYVAVMLAFNLRTHENLQLYLWDGLKVGR